MIGMRRSTAVMLCAIAALTTGCAAGGSGPVQTPRQFLDREELPSCGEVTLEQSEEIPEEAFSCLAEAGEDGAELAGTRPTTEGDPIIEYYRVLPGGGWEAYIDATEDSRGGGWWYTDCPDAETIEDLAGCRGTAI
jgi:hypothetical protein